MDLAQQAFGLRSQLGPEEGNDVEQCLPAVLACRAAEVQQHLRLGITLSHPPSEPADGLRGQLAAGYGCPITVGLEHATLHQQAAHRSWILTVQNSGEV